MISAGLFHKAIAQSGVAINPWAIQTEDPKKFTYMLAAKLGENSTDPKTVLEFLRTIDAKKLVITEMELTGEQVSFRQECKSRREAKLGNFGKFSRRTNWKLRG